LSKLVKNRKLSCFFTF